MDTTLFTLGTTIKQGANETNEQIIPKLTTFAKHMKDNYKTFNDGDWTYIVDLMEELLPERQLVITKSIPTSKLADILSNKQFKKVGEKLMEYLFGSNSNKVVSIKDDGSIIITDKDK